MKLRVRGFLALLVGLCLFTAACGDKGSSASKTTTTAASAGTTTGSTTTPSSLPDMSSAEVSVPGKGDVTYLTDVRAAHQDTGDRVTFQFDGDIPGYDIGYIKPPLTQDASGQTVAVQGVAIMRVHFSPASGVKLTDGVTKTYNGPSDITPVGTNVIQQAVAAGDFEAGLTWGIGTNAKIGFKVSTLTNPSRVVIDYEP